MVTHSGASLHRWCTFPLRSPISSALWSQNIWSHRTPYTCLCLIKLRPGPWGHFLYFFAIFFCLLSGWWKLGRETAGEVRPSITSRSSGTVDQEVIWAARDGAVNQLHNQRRASISTRGVQHGNGGNFTKWVYWWVFSCIWAPQTCSWKVCKVQTVTQTKITPEARNT